MTGKHFSYEFILSVLRTLELELPPPRDCHHVIYFLPQLNENEHEYVDRLVLQINHSGALYKLALDVDDFFKSPDALVRDILDILKQQGVQVPKNV